MDAVNDDDSLNPLRAGIVAFFRVGVTQPRARGKLDDRQHIRAKRYFLGDNLDVKLIFRRQRVENSFLADGDNLNDRSGRQSVVGDRHLVGLDFKIVAVINRNEIFRRALYFAPR